jgi:hypothetical protein
MPSHRDDPSGFSKPSGLRVWHLIVPLALCLAYACGGSKNSGFGGPGGSGSGGGGNSSGSSSGFGNFGSTGGSSSGSSVTHAACPSTLQCDVSCPNGGTTSISGTVYDPAGKNPLYNIAVFVAPSGNLPALPKGVPTGNDSCSCSALFKEGAVVSTATAVDGTFKLTNAPVGSNVPLVIQVGKWRHLVPSVNVTACQDNPLPDGSLKLPGTVASGDTNDSMPDIAISTGDADTLECLMQRIGVPASEYVAGAGTGGHVHVFSGGQTAGTVGVGKAENPGMTGAPASYQNLWASQDQLMPYDITLLSCEGAETYNANPPVLEAYLNAGGRVFSSHFHYAWFAGPIGSMQAYSAPADWGSNLATWSTGGGGGTIGHGTAIGGSIVQTLNGSSAAFPKGQTLAKWLALPQVNALGKDGVPAADVSIWQPRFNASVAPSNVPSQPWIMADPPTKAPTMYFSFDTPVNLMPTNGPDPSGKAYCGRVVFSDLHVAGNPITNDGKDPPQGCAATPLSPQEAVLEFMLFDLSSCVIPDNVTPPPPIAQ